MRARHGTAAWIANRKGLPEIAGGNAGSGVVIARTPLLQTRGGHRL